MWAKADLEEKDVVTVPMRGEHKPNSALIVWDDLVVNGVTCPTCISLNSLPMQLPLKDTGYSKAQARISLSSREISA
jgi:hypothetical protein